MSEKTICLAIIVKNESLVIGRCLASVKDFIDYWVICDTGSSDNTCAIIEEFLKEIPGELHRTRWQDFGTNRTEAIQLARHTADYTLMLDADMMVNVKERFKNHLTADAYLLQYEGDLDYYQPMLFSNKHAWRFIGKTHEYAYADTAREQTKLRAVTLIHLADGGMRADKLERDICLLREALQTDPHDSRAMFYLAQSYREQQSYDKAEKWYKARINAGGWDEEIWYSLYQIGHLQKMQDREWPVVLDAFLRAYNFRPSRLEPLYEIAIYYRLQQNYALANLFASPILKTPYPNDTLFIEKSVYTYKLPLELAICAYWLGDHPTAISIYNQLLDLDELPANYFDTCLKNRSFSLYSLYQTHETSTSHKNRMRVIVPFYNPGDYLDNCIASLLTQDYDEFDVLLIDDASTDHSHVSIPLDDPRFHLIRNQTRVGGAKNLHQALMTIEDSDVIAVFLDGDDWLSCSDALSHINRCYNESDCWVLYGQFRYSDGRYGISKPYPSAAAFKDLRQVWYSSAIRTFRAGLYHKIQEQDPDYSFMKDNHGNWYTSAMDMALMYPMLELAGFDRVRYNDRVLYVYNIDNPLNVHKQNRAEELCNNREIMQKKRFQPVETYYL